MKTAQLLQLMSVVAISVLLTSCIDSKVPLAAPDKSKPDDRLVGVWRLRGEGGELDFYHIGHAGEKMPESVLRVINVRHSPDGKVEQDEFLVFPTTLGDKTYLNVAESSPAQVKAIEEQGWSKAEIKGYWLLRYEVRGDALTLHLMDADAKKAAVEAGKVKGVVEKGRNSRNAYFTDTPENLARFVASAGDSLYSKEVLRLDRVK